MGSLFPPLLQCNPKKYGKYRLIFDLLTQMNPDEVVPNHQTPTDHEAEIDFGKAKLKLLTNIYNWRISYPREIIYLTLTNITACFQFPKILADLAGVFGFVAEFLYFISKSHVFGLNTLAGSWEAFRQAIQNLIPILSQRTDLVDKHKALLDLLKWVKKPSIGQATLCQVQPCEINRRILDESGKVRPMEANIYVDDIHASAPFKERMLQLLAAIVEAIFIVCVCGEPNIAICQCPPSMEKWLELIVGPI